MAGAHKGRVRRELRLEPTPRSRRTRGGKLPIPGSEIIQHPYNCNYPWTKTKIPRVDTAPQGVEPQPHWVVVYWLRLMEPARGESCPSGQRRHPAAPKKDQVLSPDENSFHTPTTPTNRERKQWSPRSIPPRAVRKPQPHRRIVDRLGLMEPARGESCDSGQRRGPAEPGEDKFLSPDQKSFNIRATTTNRGRKRRSPRLIPPRKV